MATSCLSPIIILSLSLKGQNAGPLSFSLFQKSLTLRLSALSTISL